MTYGQVDVMRELLNVRMSDIQTEINVVATGDIDLLEDLPIVD